MGAALPREQEPDDSTAEALFAAFTNIAAAERRKHATVFNYWLSIRGDRPYPAIRDLNPLEIPDAGPCSVLLELIGAGDDADIRHLGQALSVGQKIERISDVPSSSVLSFIAEKLPAVATTSRPVAFEGEIETADGKTLCWVTLLPFSSTETWANYVYGFISAKSVPNKVAPEPAPEEPEIEAESAPGPEAATEAEAEAEYKAEPEAIAEAEPEMEAEAEAEPPHRPGFSAELFKALERVEGFFGTTAKASPKTKDQEPEPSESDISKLLAVADEQCEAEPPAPVDEVPEVAFEEPETVVEEPELVAEEPAAVSDDQPQSNSTREGTLQNKLAEVRSKAEEARLAKLRAEAALWEGLSAAYDFALDAEENAEDYLKLVEGQGIKIQLRSPMAPVVKLAFDGSCDPATIRELEQVMAWALKMNLPRGSLVERIEAEGGVSAILGGKAQPE
jgi:hypothetical protein